MRVASLLPLLAVAPIASATAVDPEIVSRELVLLERAIQERGIADDIWDKIKSGTTCAACQV